MLAFKIKTSLAALIICLILGLPAQSAPLDAPLDQHWATPERISQYLNDVAQQAPEQMRLETLGYSRQQRPLQLASLGAANAPEQVLLVCGQHGDEPDSVQACLYLLRDLLQRQQTESQWQARLRRTQLHILLVLNPDGLANQQRRNAAGVNLNANWGYGREVPLHPSLHAEVFSPQGSSYRGAIAFSEPETRALRDWITRQSGLKALVDYHTGVAGFSQGMVLYPFTVASSDQLTAAQRELLEPLARTQAQLLSFDDPQRDAFLPMQSHEFLAYLRAAITPLVPAAHLEQALAQLPQSGQAMGSMIDWSFGVLGIPSLGFEVYFPSPDVGSQEIGEFNAFYANLGPALEQAMADLLDRPRQ